jgi:hypothetical protein
VTEFFASRQKIAADCDNARTQSFIGEIAEIASEGIEFG